MQNPKALGAAHYALQNNNDALVDPFGVGRQAVHNVGKTGNNFVDGVLSGYAWTGGKLTYAFPDNKNDYSYNPEKNNDFDEVGGKIQNSVRFILDSGYGSAANDGFSVEGFTKLAIAPGSDAQATLRFAGSSSANPTAYGYYPSEGSRGGDVWFGDNYNYENAVPGNYNFATVIHETGHALGLKHGHESSFNNGTSYPALKDKYDSLEYSVMTYNSYKGDDATGYTNENWGYPQTYMMADIAALQHMYGADYSTNSGNTRYAWRPDSSNTWVNGKIAIDPGGNRIFATIWDGGGRHDSYDLSAYDNSVRIDLDPGSYSRFRNSQLANLGLYDPGTHIASGNIYNALMYKGRTASLIEDAQGGSGNDRISGNKIGNILDGNAGNDRLFGEAGNDVYIGGRGADIFYFKQGWNRDTVADFQSNDRIDLSNFNFASTSEALSHASNDGKDVVFIFGGGSSLRLEDTHKGDLQNNDFIL